MLGNVPEPNQTVPVYELTRGDELFATLDGRFVVIDGTNWQIQIVGIHVDAPWAWVQLVALGPGGQQHASTFRIDQDVPDQLMDAVAEWLSSGHAATVALPCLRH